MDRQSPSAPRRDAAATRLRILEAAQAAFSELGYSSAGMRHIAREAQVDPAMVVRYFGTKAALFEAALAHSIPDVRQVDPGGDLGSQLAAELLGGFLDLRMQSIILLGVGDTEAREICARVLRERVIAPLAERIGTPDAQDRAIRLVMIATGYTLFTSQVPLVDPRDAATSGTADWMAGIVRDLFEAPAGPAD